MRKAAVIGFLAPVVLFGVFKFIPYLTAATASTESTPAVQPLRNASSVPVSPGSRLCVRGIVLGPQSRYAQFTPEDRRATRPPVAITAAGPGYRYGVTAPRTASGAGPITVELKPPRSEIDGARVCVRNTGGGNLYLFGVPPGLDSTVSNTTVNDKPISEDVSLTILSKRSVSRAGNLPAMLSRTASFTPFGSWALWLLTALLLAGVPVAVAGALSLSCRSEES